MVIAMSRQTLSDHPSRRLGLHVLLMDDEEGMLKVTSLLLRRIGCTWRTTTGGTATLRVYDEAVVSGTPFDAVILDLVVPDDMGGEETARQLRQRQPVPLLIGSTGYLDSPVPDNYAAHGFDAVLPKPYRLADLHRTLSAHPAARV